MRNFLKIFQFNTGCDIIGLDWIQIEWKQFHCEITALNWVEPGCVISVGFIWASNLQQIAVLLLFPIFFGGHAFIPIEICAISFGRALQEETRLKIMRPAQETPAPKPNLLPWLCRQQLPRPGPSDPSSRRPLCPSSRATFISSTSGLNMKICPVNRSKSIPSQWTKLFSERFILVENLSGTYLSGTEKEIYFPRTFCSVSDFAALTLADETI